MAAVTTGGRVRKAASIVVRARDPRLRPWRPLPRAAASVLRHRHPVRCNICGWAGPDFDGVRHSESALCRLCGSIARDRYLYHCWTACDPYSRSTRVLETSPRLGSSYRERMGSLVDYLCSDYDQGAHVAMTQIDLQAIDLPDAALDVILTPHVLEHVPDTDKALAEMHRVLAPGGAAYIMVPVPHGRTAPPTEPEYHQDHTLVYWRFGWDLTEQLRTAGFDTRILVTEQLSDMVRAGATSDVVRDDLDERSLLATASEWLADMTVVADRRTTAELGFESATMLIAWLARKPH